MLASTAVSGFDEVAGDVDPKHVRPASRRGQRRGAVSAAEIDDLEPRFRAGEPGSLAYYVLIEWEGPRIGLIRDFRYVPYIARGSRFTRG